jgi:hypothetical protein
VTRYDRSRYRVKKKDIYHAFDIGDLILSQNNDKVVIINILLDKQHYEFMNLESKKVHTLTGDIIHIDKGSIGSASINTIDKYYYLYQFIEKDILRS